MAFEYQPMTRHENLERLRQLVKQGFKDKDGYFITLPIGYEREICILGDERTIVFNNYDHPLEEEDTDYPIGTLNDDPETIVQNFVKLVKNKHLEDSNRESEKCVYNIYHSDIIAFDWNICIKRFSHRSFTREHWSYRLGPTTRSLSW